MKANTTTTTSRRCLQLSSLFFTIAGAYLTIHPSHPSTSMRIFQHQQQHARQQRQTPAVMTLVSLFQQQNDEEEQQQQQKYSPISDYVGGLHGGKYVFDERISGITALNYETSILVFDYPNHDDSSTRRQTIAPPPEGSTGKPRWASRKLDPKAFLDAELRVLDFGAQGKANVQVVNEELSWEPFWASVETSSDSGEDLHTSSRFTVSPDCGTLAPRGGSNDFSDCCRFELRRTLKNIPQHQEYKEEDKQKTFLVVRTEQDYWIWRLH